MKVYKSEYIGSYGGGMILVAANSEEEALKTAAENVYYDTLFWKLGTDGEPVFELDRRMSPLAEIPNLTYESETPAIIAENIYIE